MNRRKLIRDLAIAGPGIMIFPAMFQACRKDQVIPENPYTGKVIIVGAGASGIYASHLLRKQGIETILLEAAAVPGGRIKADTTFTDYPLELGAEKFKGKRSIFYDLAAFHTPEGLAPHAGTNFFLLDGVLRTEYYLKENAGLAGAGSTLFQVLESFASYPGSDVTVFDYLNNLPLENRFLSIANALVGNDLGADNPSLGMLAMKERASEASSGQDQYFLKNRSVWNVFEKAFPDEIDQVLTGRVVKKINYSQGTVRVETAGGELFEAGRLLLTVPLGVLKKDTIQFEPALPASKSTAISQIGFGSGFRIALKFSQPFWLGGTDQIMGGSTFPLYDINSTYRSTSQHIVTGTAMGEAATALAGLSPQEVAFKAVSELAKFYPSGGVQAKYTQQFLLHNWADEPHIQGTISFPSPGSQGQRNELAAPVNGRIYFAGEATNFNGHSGTVHGAMESAYRAVEEILRS